MNIQNRPLARRGFIRGALAAAVLVPMGGALASCASGGGGTAGPATTGAVSADNPFGLAENSTADAVIFKGGYGIDYVEFAGKKFEELHEGSTAKISPSTAISGELQPRFAGGNPPDLVDNSGAQAMGLSTILDQLEDLTPVIEAENLEGTPIKDTLYEGVLTPGTFDGKLKAINYVLTLYGLWYSDSLFQENSWTVPKTWDEAFELGEKAKAQGKFLFLWGKEAASYYLEMALASAIKEGGDEVRVNLENLKEDSWKQPAVMQVFEALDKHVKAGHFKPGGSGTAFTAAQAQWSNGQEALLYPSGSWIENEMKSQTKPDFKMTGAPVPTPSDSPKLPYEALHSGGGEPFIVPSNAKNPAAGKELLRIMLSEEAAANFAKTKLAPTIVKGTVPEDGFGSTALVSQTKMLEAAGKNVFDWKFLSLYGMNKDILVIWNSFLDGQSSAAGLADAMQALSDKIRNDPSITKAEIK
ncbi:N-acetylglucosamine/diacetylchitobiose ABC transporter substrate-binding protein [Pseudarthrobacter sp. J64]|uniref:N-acetylglucosamine/diacetylchitobiose ABC transporter substrate-binding protein n=1 Tax=Pseudarthrobacter sp. J64 TaxID=3116485 RepID=UPI002E8067BF|nr:N-acetylglucosamine/diacetylchitobiose ABC transporter substrate-binding protein [Pseudarthrobacter sp. J64]MEE2570829.1 N-acetylglucosamine/diacetylchitobiose ABC transporter substrate-binding protein [Pseudarthrobacter sp. J64]